MLKKIIIIVFISVLSSCSSSNNNSTEPQINEKTIVNKYGQLQASGKNILDKNGEAIALRGMSLFWSQWGGQYYNYETIKWLRDDWKCTVIRAAVGAENGGYLENPEIEYFKLKTVIEACIDLGIYVIIDWHDHHAEDHIEKAESFFDKVSNEYGNYPNVIYEIYNEPLDVSWQNVLKPYSERIISVIRNNDKKNLIIVGTPNWSQDVDDVINNKIEDVNVAYSLHFYASTHKKWLRDKANLAISANIPIFVSEWGLSEASGTGNINLSETNLWISFLEQNNLSWCNWSIINKDETSAAILPATSTLSGWSVDELTESGKIISEYLKKMNSPLFKEL